MDLCRLGGDIGFLVGHCGGGVVMWMVIGGWWMVKERKDKDEGMTSCFRYLSIMNLQKSDDCKYQFCHFFTIHTSTARLILCPEVFAIKVAHKPRP